MTREEAIKMAKADLKCIERDTSGQDEMCNSHKCDECSLNYERGNMGEQKEWLRLAIKALEQESILDKIRAEIEQLSDSKRDGNTVTLYSWNGMKRKVLDIINKYKAESEG